MLHTAPTRTMLADALAQYLVWKKWPHWLLVVGPHREGQAYADALRRSAKRFGAKIVEERTFNYESGSRRSDGGYEQIQQQIPTFTQSAPELRRARRRRRGQPVRRLSPLSHLGSRAPSPAPRASSPTSWHPAIELWGGTQFQNRFKRLADRTMRPLDYNAWMAARMVGEAASRTKSDQFARTSSPT